MSPSAKPGFPPLQLEEFDARLDAEAARRGIPTLTTPAPSTTSRGVEPEAEEGRAATTPAAESMHGKRTRLRRSARRQAAPQAPEDNQPTPRSRMKSLNEELPDYAWVDLKSRAAREMVSVRHIIMRLLKDAGIDIADADLLEDGRRLR